MDDISRLNADLDRLADQLESWRQHFAQPDAYSTFRSYSDENLPIRSVEWLARDTRRAMRLLETARSEVINLADYIVHETPVRTATVERPSYCEALLQLSERVASNCRLFLGLAQQQYREDQDAKFDTALLSGVCQLLAGFDGQGTKNWVACELRTVRRILDGQPAARKWSKFRSPKQWLNVLQISRSTFQRRLKDGTLHQHPESTSKRVALLIEDLPQGYSDDL